MTEHEEFTGQLAGVPLVASVEAALDAGMALAEPRALEPDVEVYSVTVPRGAMHQLVRVPAPSPEYSPAPHRARGVYRPATVEALIEVVERHHDPESSTLWVHPTSGHVVAVFNDAKPGQPGWRDHRAELSLTVTPEWKHWTGKDGQLMGQEAFAEHVEDGIAEIAEPPAADMLELAQTFHAQQSATFRSAHRLQDGRVQVQYDEQTEATAGKSGQMQIPPTFTLAIAPFLGEDPYKVTARLRYRVGGGKLSIGYKLERPDSVVRDALNSIAARLGEKFPAVFVGEPGS